MFGELYRKIKTCLAVLAENKYSVVDHEKYSKDGLMEKTWTLIVERKCNGKWAGFIYDDFLDSTFAVTEEHKRRIDAVAESKKYAEDLKRI